MQFKEGEKISAETGNGQGGQKELEAEVLGSGLCTGCGACVNLCPYQAIYRDRTVTLHSCDLDRGRCYSFCPRTPANLDVLKGRIYEGGYLTAELGAVKEFFLTRAADGGLRQKAQHGGTVTALVTLALREGLLDAAVLSETGENLLPRSVTVGDAAEAFGLGGSRFVVSSASSQGTAQRRKRSSTTPPPPITAGIADECPRYWEIRSPFR